jgi:hypothetical protein
MWGGGGDHLLHRREDVAHRVMLLAAVLEQRGGMVLSARVWDRTVAKRRKSHWERHLLGSYQGMDLLFHLFKRF